MREGAEKQICTGGNETHVFLFVCLVFFYEKEKNREQEIEARDLGQERLRQNRTARGVSPGEESHKVKEKGSRALCRRPFSPSNESPRSNPRVLCCCSCPRLLDLGLSGHPGNELQVGLLHSLCTSSHDGCALHVFPFFGQALSPLLCF